MAYGSLVSRQGSGRHFGDTTQAGADNRFVRGEICLCVLPIYLLNWMKPKAKTSYSCKLTAEQGDQLRRLLDSKGYSFREIPHALFAAQQEKLNGFTTQENW